jgi:hypothetical protein
LMDIHAENQSVRTIERRPTLHMGNHFRNAKMLTAVVRKPVPRIRPTQIFSCDNALGRGDLQGNRIFSG